LDRIPEVKEMSLIAMMLSPFLGCFLTVLVSVLFCLLGCLILFGPAGLFSFLRFDAIVIRI